MWEAQSRTRPVQEKETENSETQQGEHHHVGVCDLRCAGAFYRKGSCEDPCLGWVVTRQRLSTHTGRDCPLPRRDVSGGSEPQSRGGKFGVGLTPRTVE